MTTQTGEQERLLQKGPGAIASRSDQDVCSRRDDGNGHIHPITASTITEDDQHHEHDHDDERHVVQFFAFICVSTALRSFEAGIVASMMADIQHDLDLQYTDEGTIVASTDYGIALGSILAIFVFRRYAVRLVLATTMFGMALCAFGCVWRPTKLNLLVARSVGGLLWSQAATHYPVWINDRGNHTSSSHNKNHHKHRFTAQRKTVLLACTNVCLLAGVISGYIVGGAVRAAVAHQASDGGGGERHYGLIRSLLANCTWVDLYFFEGLLMTACGITVVLCFDGDLLSIGNKQSHNRGGQDTLSPRHYSNEQQPPQHYSSIEAAPVEEEDNTDSEDLREVVMALVRSPPFVLAVAITGCISGGIVYALYFVTQVCEARGMQVGTTLMFVTFVFVTAPAPGIIFGSWIVSTLGGYTDHVVTFGVALGSAVFVLCSAVALPLSWAIWGTWKVPFVTAFWIFAFAGAMSGPPLNGVAVSAVPHASHVASALQFSLSNAAKIFVPQIGGYVCEVVGLIDGFHATLVATAFLFVGLSWIGLVYAMKSRSNSVPSYS